MTVSGWAAEYLGGIDTTGIPEETVYIVEGATFVFLTISVAVGTGYLRNITGYAVKWLKLNASISAVHCQVKLFGVCSHENVDHG